MKRWFWYVAMLVALLFGGAAQAGTSPSTYTVKWGDTLTAIAQKFQTSVEQLVTANNIADPNKIYAGETIHIAKVSQTASVVRKEKQAASLPKAQAETPTPHIAMDFSACGDVTKAIASLNYSGEVGALLVTRVKLGQTTLRLSDEAHKQYYEVRRNETVFGLMLTDTCKAIRIDRGGTGPPEIHFVTFDRKSTHVRVDSPPENASGYVEMDDKTLLYADPNAQHEIHQLLSEIITPPYNAKPIENAMISRLRLLPYLE